MKKTIDKFDFEAEETLNNSSGERNSFSDFPYSKIPYKSKQLQQRLGCIENNMDDLENEWYQ